MGSVRSLTSLSLIALCAVGMRGGSRAGRAAENSELGRHRSGRGATPPSPPPPPGPSYPSVEGKIFSSLSPRRFLRTPVRPRSASLRGSSRRGRVKSRPMPSSTPRSEPSCRSSSSSRWSYRRYPGPTQVPATRLRRGGRRVSASGTRFESDPTAQRAARHSTS